MVQDVPKEAISNAEMRDLTQRIISEIIDKKKKDLWLKRNKYSIFLLELFFYNKTIIFSDKNPKYIKLKKLNF